MPAVAAAAFRFRPNDADRAKVKGEVPRGPKLWFVGADGTLEPVKVTEGVTDDSFTEVTAEDGSSLEGREAVVGYETATTLAAPKGAENPFMPKMPKHGSKGTAPEPKK